MANAFARRVCRASNSGAESLFIKKRLSSKHSNGVIAYRCPQFCIARWCCQSDETLEESPEGQCLRRMYYSQENKVRVRRNFLRDAGFEAPEEESDFGRLEPRR